MNYKTINQFTKKQVERIKNTIMVLIIDYHNCTQKFPYGKDREVIINELNNILLENQVYLCEKDLRNLVNERVSWFRRKTNLNKISVSLLKTYYANHYANMYGTYYDSIVCFQKYDDFFDQDDDFYYIAGYTSGGAAYGITWDEAREQGLIEDEEW